MKASVVIPTWNGAGFLPPCLDALRRQTFRDFETIVVDNGSSDDTAMVLRAYPGVRVVRLAENLGFAGGVNAGIALARGEYVVLLNNDTEADPGWIGALCAALDRWPDAGMATSKVRLFDRRDTLHTTGDTVDLSGCPANRGVWELDASQWDERRDVFGASGAAAAYRCAMLDEIGTFAEAFGSYMEDVDLSWRARLAGWRCVFVPEAVVYHHLSATGGGSMASYLVARNRVWLIARNYPARLLVRHIGPIARAQAALFASALRSWRGGAARASLRGQLVGLLTWPKMLSSRRRIQSTRRIDDDTLERLMQPEAAA